MTFPRRFISALRFYVPTAVMNIAVAIMFYSVSFRSAPVVAAVDVHEPTIHKVSALAVKSGIPARIVLPSVAINLPVVVGSYSQVNDSWTTGLKAAYYADISPPVNDNQGTTLIYGHAQSVVFGNLLAMQLGATAQVYTDSGLVFHYEYQSMRQVLPTNTDVFNTNGPPTLVLQTCIGDWDVYRALFTFRLVSVNSA